MKKDATQPPENATQVDGAALRMLQSHRGGDVLTDLSEAVREIAQAVSLTGKPGSVTLKLIMKPASRGANALVVEDEIRKTSPKTERHGSVFFTDGSFNLLRDNPNQLSMDLKVVANDEPIESEPLKRAVNQ